jgi:hypothetical protein
MHASWKLLNIATMHAMPCFFPSQYRNPVATNRPGFREVLLSLLDNAEEMISIPPEALDTHPLAGVLGSPLEAGENMYPDLQSQYYTSHDYQELS